MTTLGKKALVTGIVSVGVAGAMVVTAKIIAKERGMIDEENKTVHLNFWDTVGLVSMSLTAGTMTAISSYLLLPKTLQEAYTKDIEVVEDKEAVNE